MSILNFVTQDELDNLSEDHRAAFMELVNIAQRRLDERLGKLDPDSEKEWHERERIRYSFMNVIVAAARQFEIEPFVSMNVPTYQTYRDDDHLQFQADLDHYVTQLMLGNSMRAKLDTVAILPKTKEQLRTYLVGLKECVEKGNMTDAKRRALLEKLKAFEAELERKRLNMMTVARIAYFVLSVPGTMWASADIAHKLVTHVMETVAEAKAAEDDTKQIEVATSPPPLLAPRQPLKPQQSAFGQELDDDVPF